LSLSICQVLIAYSPLAVPWQVTFVEALDGLMPGFDPEIGKLAQRILINPRKIDYHVGVLAKKVIIALFFLPQGLAFVALHWKCISKR